MKTTSKMSNAIARRYFLHDNDADQSGRKACYFADSAGCGFWVDSDGTVDVDSVSANGEMPSDRIVEACRIAAVKYLNR